MNLWPKIMLSLSRPIFPVPYSSNPGINFDNRRITRHRSVIVNPGEHTQLVSYELHFYELIRLSLLPWLKCPSYKLFPSPMGPHGFGMAQMKWSHYGASIRRLTVMAHASLLHVTNQIFLISNPCNCQLLRKARAPKPFKYYRHKFHAILITHWQLVVGALVVDLTT